MIHALAHNWGWIALRGVAAIVFGILALVYPGSAFSVLVIFFGAYCFVDGIFALIAVFRGEPVTGSGSSCSRPWWGSPSAS